MISLILIHSSTSFFSLKNQGSHSLKHGYMRMPDFISAISRPGKICNEVFKGHFYNTFI